MNVPNRPSRQHTVSQALLREFTQEGQLIKYDLRYGKAYRRYPRAVGFFKDFISVAPEAFETLWKDIEDRLPRAIATLAEPDWQAKHDDIDTIKVAVMIHFVRNKALRLWEHRATPVALQDARNDIWREQKDLVRLEYEKRFGVSGPSDLVLRAWLDTIEPGKQLMESGFAERVANMLTWATKWVQALTIQVLVAGGEVPFILSDAPVIPFRENLDIAGYGRVALGDAQGVLLPVSPRRLVCVANNVGELVVDDITVTRLNFEQLNSAIEYVVFHPGRDMSPWLARATPFRR